MNMARKNLSDKIKKTDGINKVKKIGGEKLKSSGINSGIIGIIYLILIIIIGFIRFNYTKNKNLR